MCVGRASLFMTNKGYLCRFSFAVSVGFRVSEFVSGQRTFRGKGGRGRGGSVAVRSVLPRLAPGLSASPLHLIIPFRVFARLRRFYPHFAFGVSPPIGVPTPFQGSADARESTNHCHKPKSPNPQIQPSSSPSFAWKRPATTRARAPDTACARSHRCPSPPPLPRSPPRRAVTPTPTRWAASGWWWRLAPAVGPRSTWRPCTPRRPRGRPSSASLRSLLSRGTRASARVRTSITQDRTRRHDGDNAKRNRWSRRGASRIRLPSRGPRPWRLRSLRPCDCGR